MFDSSKKVYETRKIDVYHCLKDDGIDTYFQDQHRGDCLSPYAVVAYSGGNDVVGFSSTIHSIDIMCYVPIKNPSLIDIFVDQVKNSMKKLYPMLKDANNDVGDYSDNDIKAIMRTITYTYYKKNENV